MNITPRQETILDPRAFLEAFTGTSAKSPPWKNETMTIHDGTWTTWFEKCMQEIAQKHDYKCFSKNNDGECMNVDHTFVPRESPDEYPLYNRFPLIAVEHENGVLGSRRNGLARLDKDNAYIEWAFWKCLSMRCKLSVLVAYPWEKYRDGTLNILDQIITGWKSSYDENPNCLVLLGWWRDDEPARRDRATGVYEAFKFRKGDSKLTGME